MRKALALMIALATFALAAPAGAQTSQSCFAETGQCIAGPIREFWERGGGLSVFGFPITPQSTETVEGRPLQVQWFERDRLEIQADGRVTAGRLGVERLEQIGTPWQQGPSAPAGAGCIAFSETGHQVCGAFATLWKANGGLARFGFPVTGEIQAQLEGQAYTVQYFERRRFELHPELGPQTVLLGLLGREVYDARQGREQLAPPPTPAPPLPAPTYNECQAEPNPGAAPNYPVKIVGINKAAETVTLQNLGPDLVSLDGWHMCSIKGNQQHPVGGALAPGETRTFPGPSGPIWNNSERDDGALYNAQGQLISYWQD
jgi:hypothetical protein